MNLKKESQELQSKFELFTNRVKYSDYMMPFGKYRGKFLKDLLRDDPKYFYWILPRAMEDLKEAMLFQIKETLQ